jgi:hypothetical protein
VQQACGEQAANRRASAWRYGTIIQVARTRARRAEPAPGPDQLVLRGILGETGLDPADLRQAAPLNHELYGFYGISVWVTGTSHPRELLEATKLRRFDRHAEFTVAGLTQRGLALWATGQCPHYDVVHEDGGLDTLVTAMCDAPHRIQDNPSVDREED